MMRSCHSMAAQRTLTPRAEILADGAREHAYADVGRPDRGLGTRPVPDPPHRRRAAARVRRAGDVLRGLRARRAVRAGADALLRVPRRRATPTRCSRSVEAFAPARRRRLPAGGPAAGDLRRPARRRPGLPDRAGPAHPRQPRASRPEAPPRGAGGDGHRQRRPPRRLRPADRADRRGLHARLALAPAAGRRRAVRAGAHVRRPRRRSCSSAARPTTASASWSARRTSWTSSTPRSGSARESSRRCVARARDRGQPPQRAVPVVREPRLPAPGGRPARGLRDAVARRTAWSRTSTTSRSPTRTSSPRSCTPPCAFRRPTQRVRVRGRRKAEAFRASHVYPRLSTIFLNDLRVFGTHRAWAV